MACNENVIKNIANEVTRECQVRNVNVDTEFVVFLIGFLLLNPKYGKLFERTLNRNNLEYFVNECVAMLARGDTPINTLKMQFLILSNYDKPQNLIEKHVDKIETCLRHLVNEIVEADPDVESDEEISKLYRKISIYIVLASGLGNPSVILILKEGLAALESVFTTEDLQIYVSLPRPEKLAKLKELMEVVSGVRLFNRDCKKSGDLIPDLPMDLVDAGKACLSSLSHSLVSVMQRVNVLTTAVADSINIDDETGNVVIDIPPNTDLTREQYEQMFDLLSFNRQYEVFNRKLLSDIENLVQSAQEHVDRNQEVLDEIHAAVKYKEAVPVTTVFPLFTKLWRVWRSMQNIMYVVSIVNVLMQTMASIQDHTKIPTQVLDKMLKGRAVLTDQDRMTSRVSIAQRLSLVSMPNYVVYSDTGLNDSWEKHCQFLGFCAICLSVGALVPSNMKLGMIKVQNMRYGFCNVKMASKFSKDPQRYVNEAIDYARNHPHIISLLNILDAVKAVQNIDVLVEKFLPKIQKSDEAVQTEVHPIAKYIEKNYSWDLWKWKRRACQWANIVNCKTHSTQTNYSHLRSEIHCQTVEPRDKCLQTKKDTAMNTNVCEFFLWGLRGQLGDGQHSMNFVQPHTRDRRKPHSISTCRWPCIDRVLEPGGGSITSSDYSDSLDDVIDDVKFGDGQFYDPGEGKKAGLFRTESRMVSKKNAF